MTVSDLQQIKEKIYKEEKVIELLKLLDCYDIKIEQGGELFTSALPDGNNKRSVQIKNNEYLSCNIRSKGIYGDIYTLVSYIIYNCETESELTSNIGKSKYWICNQLEYYEFIDDFYKLTLDEDSIPEKQFDPLNWLKKIKSVKKETVPNNIFDITILNRYEIIPYLGWIKEGISYKTQREFNIGYCHFSERIIFPVHNKNGDLVGVKGRYIGENKEIEENYKYLYLFPCNKSIELFNLHRARKYILEKNEVIVVEGAKTVMTLWSWGIKNVVSIEGDKLSSAQIELLKELGTNIKIIFAWDKDKEIEFIKNQIDQVKGRRRYAIYDKVGFLKGKDSPTDKGEKIFKTLYNKNCYKI